MQTLGAAGALLIAGMAASQAQTPAQTPAEAPAQAQAQASAQAPVGVPGVTASTIVHPAKPVAAAKPLSPSASVPVVANAAAVPGPALFTTIAAGGLTITLGATTLADVAAAFGGTVEEGGTEGARAHWLCYAGTSAAGPAIFWFISDAEMGGTAETLTSVAVEPQGAGGAGTCATAPDGLTAIDAGLPGPGTRLPDLRAALGTATPGPVGHVHYATISPADGAEGASTLQTAVYTGAAGKVTGLALTSVTTN